MRVGIDVGGTKIRIGVVRDGGQFKFKSKLEVGKFDLSGKFEEDFGKLVGEVKKLVGKGKIERVGVGLPGVVDEKQGMLVKSPNLPGWEKRPVRERLAKEWGCEVVVKNDAVMAGLGEAALGWGKDEEEFLYITWGTGWGVVKMEKGEEGWRGVTMEAGHQIVDGQGPECGCGQRGCLEAYVGGGRAKQVWGLKLEEVEDEKIWDEIAERAAQGLMNTLVHYPVGLVVFGGGVVLNQKHLVDRIEKELKRRLKTYPVPDLKLSKLGEWAGVYGAIVGSLEIKSEKLRGNR